MINSLGGGGAERVLVNLVNNIDKSKYDVTVQTMFPAGVNKEYLSKHIHLKEGKLPLFKGVSSIIKHLPARLLMKLCKVENGYDIVIAYMHGAPTKVLWKVQNCKKVAWLHCDMEHSSLHKFFSSQEVVECFGTFDRIVGVSKSVCDSFAKLYGLSDKLCVLYNTNDTEKIKVLSREPAHKFGEWVKYEGLKMVTVGRLHPQKGYDRLLKCCEKMKSLGIRYKLLILGKGSEYDRLNASIKELHLEDCVILGGYINNPYPYIKAADLFVCSSRYEGLSTVMSETIVLGTPIITTNVSGAEEVIGSNSEYGYLVNNDDEALMQGLIELSQNPSLIEHYEKKAMERAVFFNTSTTVKAVERMIDEVCSE